MELLNNFLSFLENVSNFKETIFESYLSFIVVITCAIVIIQAIWPRIRRFIEKPLRHTIMRPFIKNKVCVNLSFMESADVYYAIDYFIPTRYSTVYDPGYDDEPAPIYVVTSGDKEPLLIEHFIKFEFDINSGNKYYLCLADCGMGKTTFLINFYYRMLKQGKYPCHFISLQDVLCLEQIEKITDKGKTVILLDALDENEHALNDYDRFMEKLEEKTQAFYRVIITSRTNFFETEAKEHLSEYKKVSGLTSKWPKLKKLYITPFTDEDIQQFLRLKYCKKMVDYLKKALIYGHTSRISS